MTSEPPFIIDSTIAELFRAELETQCEVLSSGIVALEQTPQNATQIESLMRAAHSIKGAARIIHLDLIVTLAHALEDYFVAIQEKNIVLNQVAADHMLAVVDFFLQLSKIPMSEVFKWLEQKTVWVEEQIKGLHIETSAKDEQTSLKKIEKEPFNHPSPQDGGKGAAQADLAATEKSPLPLSIFEEPFQAETDLKNTRHIRVAYQTLNRLMGLAGESLIESNWLFSFRESIFKLKKQLNQLSKNLDLFSTSIDASFLNEWGEHYLKDAMNDSLEIRQSVAERLTELDMFIGRYSNLSDRFYQEILESRMRPFSDGVQGFPRMVRDLAKELGKKVRLEVKGNHVPVDREILEKLEAPLGHLLRNAIDHGLETSDERVALGKAGEGVIRIEAQHRAGMLSITVADDGKGVNLETIKKKIIEKKLATPEIIKNLSLQEYLDFLFLPGFSTAEKITDISGRGIGLSVVYNMVQEVGGSIRMNTKEGIGTQFYLQLPLTLSVMRVLLVDIAGEPYAFPLVKIDHVLFVLKKDVECIENRKYFNFKGQNIGLILASSVLEQKSFNQSECFQKEGEVYSVVLLSDQKNAYGLIVDQFLGGKELVVQELDERLGKVPNISCGALMEDGSPVLILDVEDLIRSIDTALDKEEASFALEEKPSLKQKTKKTILVVDDSLTVREVQCRMLKSQGYEVETAVNGMDAWNALRLASYDLLITDVDMPRMNGIELIKLVRGDTRLKELPVIIVSYKESEKDRMLGIEAGANYYLTKSSFQDQDSLAAVYDLIGKS